MDIIINKKTAPIVAPNKYAIGITMKFSYRKQGLGIFRNSINKIYKIETINKIVKADITVKDFLFNRIYSAYIFF